MKKKAKAYGKQSKNISIYAASSHHASFKGEGAYAWISLKHRRAIYILEYQRLYGNSIISVNLNFKPLKYKTSMCGGFHPQRTPNLCKLPRRHIRTNSWTKWDIIIQVPTITIALISSSSLLCLSCSSQQELSYSKQLQQPLLPHPICLVGDH